jgi:hypothetical protein
MHVWWGGQATCTRLHDRNSQTPQHDKPLLMHEATLPLLQQLYLAAKLCRQVAYTLPGVHCCWPRRLAVFVLY